MSSNKSQPRPRNLSELPQLRTVDAWRAALGLLPVPLRETAENRQRYVLLNGTTGNFCLDFVGGTERNAQRAAAWSCDVGHYITLANGSVVVNRWDRQASEEIYSSQSVISQLHEFHRYLEKTAPDRSRSIVAHVLRIFHQIREAVGGQNNGLRSLRILLHLLASASTEQYRLPEQDFEGWGLSADVIESSQAIPDATWLPLYNDLSGIGRYDVLRPDFQLVLRHASGAVFQDAHLEAQLSPNSWLPGFERPATIDPKAAPSETGTYFTPPALARTLAEEATSDIQNLEDRSLLIFDPACGSGELLKECLRLLKLKGYSGRIRATGWDKSDVSVEMARFALACEKRVWPTDQVEVEVTQHDSLATGTNWPPGVDILLMNPPFRSWQRMNPEEQEAVTRVLGSSSKPNLAMAFARRALDVLSDGGALAMITPNSVLEASSGSQVREALAGTLTPQLIARLGDQSIFSRALVDAGMYVGKRKPAHAPTTAILWADSRPNSLSYALRGLRRWRGAEVDPISEDGFSVYRRDDIGKTATPWIARSYEALAAFESVRRTRRTVPAKKVFQIRQGVRLGSDVFVVSKEYIQGLRRSERRFFRPAVMNPSISDGHLNDGYFVFYPYTTGLPAITSEHDLEEHVPTYYKELLTAKPKLSARKSLVEGGLAWWDLLRHRPWHEEHSVKIVSKYFGGARSFALDQAGEFIVVVGNAWLLEKGLCHSVLRTKRFTLLCWPT